MEPEFIVVEECNRYFIVQQRWGHDNGKSVSDSWPWEDATHGVTFQTAYIFTPMAGPYARVYREWCNHDSRRTRKMDFGYIVEARTKRQVVDEMVRRGHHAMFRHDMLHPTDCEHQIEEFEMDCKDGTADYDDHYRGRGAAYASRREPAVALGRLQHRLLAQAAALQEEIDRIESFPEEPEWGNDPTVIYFQKSFGGNQTYDYAAIRAGDGKWYTTGPRSPKGYTWTALIAWINEGEDVTVSLARKFKVI